MDFKIVGGRRCSVRWQNWSVPAYQNGTSSLYIFVDAMLTLCVCTCAIQQFMLQTEKRSSICVIWCGIDNCYINNNGFFKSTQLKPKLLYISMIISLTVLTLICLHLNTKRAISAKKLLCSTSSLRGTTGLTTTTQWAR